MPTPVKGYRTADGKRVPSVSTIIGRWKDADRLMGWAYKRGLEGLSMYEEKTTAATIGTAVHDGIERYLKDTENALIGSDKYKALSQEERAKAASSYDAFRRWEQTFKLTVVAQEIQMVSEKYRYGGTPDLVAMVGNQLCLLDWKTSGGIYESMLVQVAAYRELWNENHPDNPIDGPIHILRFSKEHADFTHKSFNDLSDGWEQFLLFRRAYTLDQQLKKRAN